MDAPPESLSTDVAAETFDQVWGQVRSQYFDYERIADDWVEAREKLRPKALNAPDIAALRGTLDELLALIGESHFTVIPREAMQKLEEIPVERDSEIALEAGGSGGIAATGLAVRLVDGELRVSRSAPGSNAAAAGIRTGWILTGLDDYPLADQLGAVSGPLESPEQTLMQAAVNSVLAFPSVGQELQLNFIDDAGQGHTITLVGEPLEADLVQLGNLPPMPYAFDLERAELGENCATVLTFSAWTPELMSDIREHREAMFECDGLVIDLRGNLGGVIGTMSTLAGHLFNETALLGTLVRSDGRIDFRAFPRRVTMSGDRVEPFSGPIAIVIDRLSASTSEMFASGMQAAGRARVFGERSPGMALPAQMLPLASGDVLMYAFADYADGEGRRIEGVGVTPDESVGWSDPERPDAAPRPVAAALAWIDRRIDSEHVTGD